MSSTSVNYLFNDIENLISDETVVIRLSDSSSISPVTSKGFIASTLPLAPTPSQWRQSTGKAYPYYTSTDFLLDRSTIDGIIKHVTGGWGGYTYRPTPSPWISSTSSVSWAIWEMTRRLTMLSNVNYVHMSIIRRQKGHSSNYRGCKAIHHDATRALHRYEEKYPQGRELLDEEVYRKAMNFVIVSEEVLWYERIFAKDVLETTIWTQDECPLNLPREYWSSTRRWTGTKSWLDRLIWDPKQDSFRAMARKVEDRNMELERSWLATAQRDERMRR